MKCYVCRDRGIVQWNEKRNGNIYTFEGRCKCDSGRKFPGMPSAEAALSPFEINEIIEQNKRLEAENAKNHANQ